MQLWFCMQMTQYRLVFGIVKKYVYMCVYHHLIVECKCFRMPHELQAILVSELKGFRHVFSNIHTQALLYSAIIHKRSFQTYCRCMPSMEGGRRRVSVRSRRRSHRYSYEMGIATPFSSSATIS